AKAAPTNTNNVKKLMNTYLLVPEIPACPAIPCTAFQRRREKAQQGHPLIKNRCETYRRFSPILANDPK
ncbi:MAG: hypothetical protein Q7U66_01500, partial [Methylobacter sp.]|nr:hypothetical protein [Methylobacter sp.]